MSLSDVNAKSLGVNVDKTRRNTIFIVALLAAVTVSFAGPIGFIGLVAPHISRMISGEDQRFFMPISALIGAIFLSVASILCKTLIPGTILPIGLVTSIIGIPFFVSLIVRKKRSYM
jgi:iron complex transport system permease protein